MTEDVVKRGIVAGAAGVAIVVTALAGCSSKNSSSNPSSSPAAPPAPKIIVDGQNQNVPGAVTCTPSGKNINIGFGDPSNGVGAVVSTDNPPIVHAVGLGTVNNVMLGYADAAPGQESNAGAAVSGKTYSIKGTATGSDMTNPEQPQPVTKPFEMDFTCP
jgi:lipoprotein LpqH